MADLSRDIYGVSNLYRLGVPVFLLPRAYQSWLSSSR
jgi:hypothetical protein